VLAARLDISVNIKVVGKSLTRSQLKALWTRKRMVKMVKMAGLNGVGAEAWRRSHFVTGIQIGGSFGATLSEIMTRLD